MTSFTGITAVAKYLSVILLYFIVYVDSTVLSLVNKHFTTVFKSIKYQILLLYHVVLVGVFSLIVQNKQ